jgi:hypothetical protein
MYVVYVWHGCQICLGPVHDEFLSKEVSQEKGLRMAENGQGAKATSTTTSYDINKWQKAR